MEKLPVTVRRSIELLGLLGVFVVISQGKDILMPLILAAFLSLLLLPVYRWLRRRRLPDFLAILLSILLLLVAIAAVGIFLSFQVAGLLKDIPTMKKNLAIHWQTISNWIAGHWHVSISKQLDIINTQVGNIGDNMAGTLQNAALSLTNIFIFIGLVPIYTFMILFYKSQIRHFILMWFNRDKHAKVTEAFNETQVMAKYYLVSLLIQITYLTVLLGGALSLFGIKHALLIGVAFGVLNLIPYVGALIGNLLGVLLTLTSSDQLWEIWVVLGTIAVVQFLDNNILMPRIVGSRVKINSLASIVGIVIGGNLAGVSGMFLSIPVMAVLKIVFDKSPTMQQWGVLLAEPEPNKKPADTVVGELKQSLENKRDEEIEGKEHEK
jgi:predicted PurR-regulated permease PerM